MRKETAPACAKNVRQKIPHRRMHKKPTENCNKFPHVRAMHAFRHSRRSFFRIYDVGSAATTTTTTSASVMRTTRERKQSCANRTAAAAAAAKSVRPFVVVVVAVAPTQRRRYRLYRSVGAGRRRAVCVGVSIAQVHAKGCTHHIHTMPI